MWRLPAPSPSRALSEFHEAMSSYCFPPSTPLRNTLSNAPIHVSPGPPFPTWLTDILRRRRANKKKNGLSGPGSVRHFNDFNEPHAIHPHIWSSQNRTFCYDVCFTGGPTSRKSTHTQKTRLLLNLRKK